MYLVQLATPSIWFLCGSQHLYGEGPLKQVAANAAAVVDGLNRGKRLPLPLTFKALLTTPDEITQVMLAANADPDCAGLVLWMHTFSPCQDVDQRALTCCANHFLHLHTQAGQSTALGHHRHGLHEPQPGRSR
jgi:L-arabinose isomerase